MGTSKKLTDCAELRNRPHVFRDRTHAGELLAQMMRELQMTDSTVFGIPAGGVPVAAEVARRLALDLDVAVVSKITLPWNTEAGYGAVAFDGTVRLNTTVVSASGLSKSEVARGIAATREKVARRVTRLRGVRPYPDLSRRRAVLIDDGLASGFTMQVAVEALKGIGAREIIVAVPTAHAHSAARIVQFVNALYCPNICEARHYAVADAYERWSDVSEDAAMQALDDWRHAALFEGQHAVTSDSAVARWEHFEHGADIGVRGLGPTREQAFQQAALALTGVVTEPGAVRATQAVSVECDAPDEELLLVDWLNALIFEMSTRRMLFGRFEVTFCDLHLRGTAWGELADVTRHEPAVEAKGATYTALCVTKQNDQWIAQCVVDV